MIPPRFRPLAVLLLAGALAAPLAPAPAAAQAPLEMAPEDRAVLRAEVRRYLLEHPEVILEAVQVFEERRRLAEAEAEAEMLAARRAELEDDGYSVVTGNPEGDLTVVEFVDYNCGFCRRAHPHTRALIEADPGVRYVIKEFPILGAESVAAARAAVAASLQDEDKYLAFNDAMMRHDARLDEAAVWAIARRVGLDPDRLRRDAAGDEVSARLARTADLARSLGIEGTPSFVIGDRVERGMLTLEQLEARVAEARSQGG